MTHTQTTKMLLQKLIRKTFSAAMIAGTFGLFGLPWTLMSDFGRPWAGQRWLDVRAAACVLPPADAAQAQAQATSTASRPRVKNGWWV